MSIILYRNDIEMMYMYIDYKYTCNMILKNTKKGIQISLERDRDRQRYIKRESMRDIGREGEKKMERERDRNSEREKEKRKRVKRE